MVPAMAEPTWELVPYDSSARINEWISRGSWWRKGAAAIVGAAACATVLPIGVILIGTVVADRLHGPVRVEIPAKVDQRAKLHKWYRDRGLPIPDPLDNGF